ncbi:hypothetical protein STRIP9103_09108 [Streptomyces ipomoeae 91-03]|uniref:Uncharacterized protein n=1 Tax=Streptomyces ipomoeae 91-03 TaxID=698759 RepID=L1L8S7_9ACTN|nr:hypothetical protein STRIP9103_09108 [Streptomyces ipomoeae 91-03]
MILPRQGSHAQASQFIHGRRGPLGISRGVSDHQLERSSDDPAGVIDFANGQLESGEQVLARLDPAGPSQRNESADPDGGSVSPLRSRRRWWGIHASASPVWRFGCGLPGSRSGRAQ